MCASVRGRGELPGVKRESECLFLVGFGRIYFDNNGLNGVHRLQNWSSSKNARGIFRHNFLKFFLTLSQTSLEKNPTGEPLLMTESIPIKS